MRDPCAGVPVVGMARPRPGFQRRTGAIADPQPGPAICGLLCDVGVAGETSKLWTMVAFLYITEFQWPVGVADTPNAAQQA